MANRTALATEIYNVLNTTANANATEKQKLRDRAVRLYPNHWQNFLTANTLNDTVANRLRFVAWMVVVGYLTDIFKAGQAREYDDTRPAAEEL